MTITKRSQKIWMLIRKVVESDRGWPTGQRINEPRIWAPEESTTYEECRSRWDSFSHHLGKTLLSNGFVLIIDDSPKKMVGFTPPYIAWVGFYANKKAAPEFWERQLILSMHRSMKNDQESIRSAFFRRSLTGRPCGHEASSLSTSSSAIIRASGGRA